MQDFRNGKDYDILGARVSPEGKVLDTEPIKVAVGGGTQSSLRICLSIVLGYSPSPPVSVCGTACFNSRYESFLVNLKF